MIGRLLRMWRSEAGAGAAEFALVLPLLLILLFGIIDAGRFMWEFNRAEKATQVGARMAIVTSALAPGLIEEDYAGANIGGDLVGPGDVIPAEALGVIACTSTGCTCEASPCPADLGTLDSTTFNNVLVARMQQIMPAITADKVEVRYSGSGLGQAGALAGGTGGGGGGGGAADTMEISPLVTVGLTDLKFQPITCLVFLCEIDMPAFATTLTAEDVSGSVSN